MQWGKQLRLQKPRLLRLGQTEATPRCAGICVHQLPAGFHAMNLEPGPVKGQPVPLSLSQTMLTDLSSDLKGESGRIGPQI